MGDDWRVRIALVDLPRELTDDDQAYARGYPANPQEITAAAAVHAEMESYRQALIPELGTPPRPSGSSRVERYRHFFLRLQRRIG